jgi:hypothetical protein
MQMPSNFPKQNDKWLDDDSDIPDLSIGQLKLDNTKIQNCEIFGIIGRKPGLQYFEFTLFITAAKVTSMNNLTLLILTFI